MRHAIRWTPAVPLLLLLVVSALAPSAQAEDPLRKGAPPNERIVSSEFRLEVPGGFTEASSLAETTAGLEAAALCAAGGFPVRPEADVRVYALGGEAAPQAVFAVVRLSTSGTPASVATLTPERLAQMARASPGTGPQEDLDVRKVIVGKSGAVPAIEVQGPVDIGPGIRHTTWALVVPRKDFVLVVALSTTSDDPKWQATWSEATGSLVVLAPPPRGGGSELPLLALLGGGVLVLLVGGALWKSMRRPSVVQDGTGGASYRGAIAAPGSIRAIDGLPVFPGAAAAVPTPADLHEADAEIAAPAAPAPPARPQPVPRPPPAPSRPSAASRQVVVSRPVPPTPPAAAPVASAQPAPATAVPPPPPTPARPAAARPAAPRPAAANPTGQAAPARPAAPRAPSPAPVSLEPQPRLRTPASVPAGATTPAAPARTAKITRNSDFLTG